MLYSHASNGDIHEYSLKGGQGFLICPGQINLYTADAKEPWKYVWVEFDGMRAEDSLLQAGLDQDHPIYNPRTPEEGDLLQEQMLYFSEHASRSPLHLVGRLSLLMAWAGQFPAQRPQAVQALPALGTRPAPPAFL